jgi:hypothetical protein
MSNTTAVTVFSISISKFVRTASHTAVYDAAKFETEPCNGN